MLRKPLKLAATATLLISSSVVIAIPFNSYDPRSMGMGGTGVAVGDASTAPLFNPALLSLTREDDHFALILPSLGIRIADPDKLRDSIDKFQSGNYVNNLQTSVDKLSSDIALGNNAAVTGDATTIGNNLSAVSAQLAKLSNKPITVDGGVAVVIAVPSDKFGVAFFANGAVATGGVFKYNDGTILEFETRGWYTNQEGYKGNEAGNIFYGTEGYLEILGDTWRAFRKREKEPFATSKENVVSPPENHYINFIEAVRSGKSDLLHCDVMEGVMSSDLPHLANIAYRLRRELHFNGAAEKFVNDPEADGMLTRKEYRKPYLLPDKV